MTRIILSAVALVLAGCAGSPDFAGPFHEGCVMGAKLPAKAVVIPPAPDVPPQFAAWSSEWCGNWDVGTPSSLIVSTIDRDGRVFGYYVWGMDPRHGLYKADLEVSAGTIDPNTGILHFDTFDFVLNAGKLQGTYRKGAGVSHITMQKW